MVIQRIQTLMLLIAVAFMVLFCCTPFATAVAESQPTTLFLKDAPAFLVLNIVIAALLFITIFKFKNLRQQMRLTVLALVLICASMVTSGFILTVGMPGAKPVLLGGIFLPVFALIFGLLALRGMKHDHKLLSGMDRLR